MSTDNEPERPTGEIESLPSPEVETDSDPPMIYVASLSDYNAGHLHGTWIDASQDPEAIDSQIYDMLSRSQEPIAEEIAIHDYSGFGAWRPDEYEPIETVAIVAQAIGDHGPAITHWIDYLGTGADEAVGSFENAYLGHWPSTTAYAEHLVEDLGVAITVEPAGWERYVSFDTEALARDLEIELHASQEPDGTVHIFDPSAAD